jgi:hypothetical protein
VVVRLDLAAVDRRDQGSGGPLTAHTTRSTLSAPSTRSVFTPSTRGRVIVSQFPTVATIFATTGESVDRMAELLPRLR